MAHIVNWGWRRERGEELGGGGKEEEVDSKKPTNSTHRDPNF